jgi:1-acyl-sn-glycerol-3-phosphate acyltransferase
MIRALRSVWIWGAIAAIVLVGFPLVALARLFDRDPARYRTGRMLRRLGVPMGWVNPTWRVHIEGVRIEDPRRPYVVVSNHQSQADIPLISHLPWEMKWIAKEDLFRVPFVGWMMRLAGDISLDRKDRRAGARALLEARRYLEKHCSVMIFPEGTRSPDGRVQHFTDGAFLLAIRAGVPVLPLAVEGSRDCLPKRSWIFGETQDIYLMVLPPVETTGLATADVAALRDRVRRTIVEAVAARRGVSADEADALAGKASHLAETAASHPNRNHESQLDPEEQG